MKNVVFFWGNNGRLPLELSVGALGVKFKETILIKISLRVNFFYFPWLPTAKRTNLALSVINHWGNYA